MRKGAKELRYLTEGLPRGNLIGSGLLRFIPPDGPTVTPAESAVTAALMLLEDAEMNWDDVDAAAVRAMIAESDAEGGEIPLEEVARRLAAKSMSH